MKWNLLGSACKTRDHDIKWNKEDSDTYCIVFSSFFNSRFIVDSSNHAHEVHHIWMQNGVHRKKGDECVGGQGTEQSKNSWYILKKLCLWLNTMYVYNTMYKTQYYEQWLYNNISDIKQPSGSLKQEHLKFISIVSMAWSYKNLLGTFQPLYWLLKWAHM